MPEASAMPAAIKDFLARWEGPINTRIYDLLDTLGGTLSAEHGIGRLKRDEQRRRFRHHPGVHR